jgi:heme oxygenase
VHAHCISLAFNMQSSWVLARLDQQTRPRHAIADADRLAPITAGVTADGYRQFLTRVYGFEAAVETSIQLTPGVGEIVDLRSRVQLRLLKSDLLALGITNCAKLPRCRSVALFRTLHEALGWMYVLDRNLRLHGVLRRHLERQIAKQLATAGAYLSGNDRAAGSRLRELGDALDSVAKTPEDADRIVVAAHTAFRCQRHWFADVMPPRVRAA